MNEESAGTREELEETETDLNPSINQADLPHLNPFPPCSQEHLPGHHAPSHLHTLYNHFIQYISFMALYYNFVVLYGFIL